MDPLTLGAIIVAGASLVSAGISAYSGHKANKQNQKNAKEQFEYQKYLNTHSNQLSVADMQASGLNPALSHSTSLSSGSFNSNQSSISADLSPITSFASSVLSAKTSKEIAIANNSTQKELSKDSLEVQKEIAKAQLEETNRHNQELEAIQRQSNSNTSRSLDQADRSLDQKDKELADKNELLIAQTENLNSLTDEQIIKTIEDNEAGRYKTGFLGDTARLINNAFQVFKNYGSLEIDGKTYNFRGKDGLRNFLHYSRELKRKKRQSGNRPGASSNW